MNKNQYSIKNFYIRNITKIYKSYWLIWILFVPVGLVRGRAFYKIYGQNYIFKAITDFLGIQKILGYKSYNPTWWFITLILGLYLLFPLIYRLAKKVPILLLISSTAIMFLPNIKTANLNIISTFKDWILPFTFGIIISEYHILEKLHKCLHKREILKLAVCISIFVFSIYIRKHGKYFYNLKIDTLFSFSILLICLEYISKINIIKRFLMFVGHHSFNIYLFHTFLYGIYLRDFIYSLKYPLLIWLALLLISLNLSVPIEKLEHILKNAFHTKKHLTSNIPIN